jgi:hypothetical protein
MTWLNPIVSVIPVDTYAHGASPFVQVLITDKSCHGFNLVIFHSDVNSNGKRSTSNFRIYIPLCIVTGAEGRPYHSAEQPFRKNSG